MAANLRRTDYDKRRQTTRRRTPREHSSNPQTPNYKREPFATRSGKIVGNVLSLAALNCLEAAMLKQQSGGQKQIRNKANSPRECRGLSDIFNRFNDSTPVSTRCPVAPKARREWSP